MTNFELRIGERLEYLWDWTKELEPDNDIIIASVFEVPDDIIQDGNFFLHTKAIVWLTGAASPGTREVTNQITTEAGRIFRRPASVVTP